MKQTVITPGVQSKYTSAEIKKLFDQGFSMLSKPDKEDQHQYKLRILKGIVSEEKVWLIEDAQAVTLLLPSEY